MNEEYETILIDLGKKEQFNKEFSKLSPTNKIPVIVDTENNQRIFESGAILIYLGEKSGNILSRGEQKLLILLVFLSFGEFFSKLENKNLIYLIDDLASELDQKNLNLAMQFLNITKGQKIITSVKKIENESINQLIDL